MSAESKAYIRWFIDEGWNRKNPSAFDGRIESEFASRTPSGKRIGVRGVSMWRIVGGGSLSEKVAWDDLGLMQQLGLAPGAAR